MDDVNSIIHKMDVLQIPWNVLCALWVIYLGYLKLSLESVLSALTKAAQEKGNG